MNMHTPDLTADTYDQMPSDDARSIVGLRQALLDLSMDDIVEIAEGNGPEPLATYQPPSQSGGSGMFNVISGVKTQYDEEFTSGDFTNRLAADMLRSLTSDQAQTPENYIRARETALEMTKSDIFMRFDQEYADAQGYHEESTEPQLVGYTHD